MSFKHFLSLAICLSVLAGCNHRKTENINAAEKTESASQLSGTISISGAYALSPLAKKWAESFIKLHPQVKIDIVETGTGQGLDALIGKQVQLAMISRPLLDEEKDAGVWVIPVAKDGVAPIVNSKNPYLSRLLRQGLSPDEFQKIFTGDVPMRWSEVLDTIGNDRIIVYSRSDESGAADILAGFLFKKASDLKGIKVSGDNDMIKSIQGNTLAIGFCNFSFAFDAQTGERTDNVQIIPFDLDFDNKVDRREIPFRNIEEAHRSVWLGLYPDILCRELTFGSMGKPADTIVIEFLRFVLSEGQEEVRNEGFCKLNNVYLKYSLESLD